MKAYYILLATVLGLLFIIVLAFVISPVDGLTGVAHPDIPNMKISPHNVDEYSHTRWLGYAFALILIVMFITLLYIGSLKNESSTGMARWVIIFGVIYTVVFSAMVFSNWSYVASPVDTFIGQMPKPTAWMIYIVWLSPMFMALVYIFNFDRWVISDKEVEELSEFLKSN